MNSIQDTATANHSSTATDRKPGRGRRGKSSEPSAALMPAAVHDEARSGTANETPTNHPGAKTMNETNIGSDILNATAQAKFVLFGIPRGEQVDKGPVMRGFIEVKTNDVAAPVKVNVAAWLKIGRASGTEYLSPKVGNNTLEDPEDYAVGPFYGRLFRQGEGARARYFGFIENAEKTGEDENGQGTYETHWQLRVNARPAVSNDQKTKYISGQVSPSQAQEEATEGDPLPF